MLRNRLGDVILIFFLAQRIYSYRLSISINIRAMCFIVIFFAGITKRAQFPFSSWLPQAIAAPTPTRALVHSRTLVTAGIYLFLKYFFLFTNYFSLLCFFLFGFTTLVISGVTSLIEIDCKKVIALRTLNQLGFITLCLSLGNRSLVFFHLITHAFFKRCMFLQIGFFIHNSYSSQDFRVFSSSGRRRFLRSLIFILCLIRICGVSFTRGFASKEVLLFSFIHSNFSLFFFLRIILIIGFTILYSTRLVHSLFSRNSCVFNSSFTKLIRASSRVLLFFGLFFGFWFSKRYFLFFNLVGGKETLILFLRFLIFLVLFKIPKGSLVGNIVFQDNFYKVLKLGLNKHVFLRNTGLLRVSTKLLSLFFRRLMFRRRTKVGSYLVLIFVFLFLNL